MFKNKCTFRELQEYTFVPNAGWKEILKNNKRNSVVAKIQHKTHKRTAVRILDL